MKKALPPVQVVEVENEGLIKLLGQQCIFFCMNYIYTGKLIGVNESCIQLEDACIVYETGALSEKTFKLKESFGVSEYYIQKGAIESFGLTNKR
jgi:hypothetical protein